MPIADPTYVALASAHAHFDGPTAVGSGQPAHEANRGCLCVPKLAKRSSVLQRVTVASFGAWLASTQVYSQL